jgi:ubiquinone/menaquinone biosynthesis C-methylase UbiE
MADLQTFYSELYAENARLTASVHGRLEFVRTQEILRRHLPKPPAKVLDVGGATGIHSRWLATDGYDVTLIDPVSEQVQMASEIAGVKARVGDARSLEEADSSVDAVIMLGPLYHLLERSERLAAIGEALRVVRPGGLVAGAAVSRHAPGMDLASRGLLDEKFTQVVGDIVETGRGPMLPDNFMELAYLHSPEGLTEEMVAGGCVDVQTYGLEGPSWTAADVSGDPEVEACALRLARQLELDPAIRSASAHLLAVGRKVTTHT